MRHALDSAAAKFESWGFDAEMRERGWSEPPGAPALFERLFAAESFEWNRLPTFQEVTLRLIVERLLTQSERQSGDEASLASPQPPQTYIQGEASRQRPILAPPPPAQYHLFCHAHNRGAAALVREVVEAVGLDLVWTDDPTALPRCSCMLLYLTCLTWTSDESSVALAAFVEAALERGTELLLAHEMPTLSHGQRSSPMLTTPRSSQSAHGVFESEEGDRLRHEPCRTATPTTEYGNRHAILFDKLFEPHHTPPVLLAAGVYSSIAVALKYRRLQHNQRPQAPLPMLPLAVAKRGATN